MYCIQNLVYRTLEIMQLKVKRKDDSSDQECGKHFLKLHQDMTCSWYQIMVFRVTSHQNCMSSYATLQMISYFHLKQWKSWNLSNLWYILSLSLSHCIPSVHIFFLWKNQPDFIIYLYKKKLQLHSRPKHTLYSLVLQCNTCI